MKVAAFEAVTMQDSTVLRNWAPDLEILCAGGSWFAGFSGFLGSGPLMALTPAGLDVWRLLMQPSCSTLQPRGTGPCAHLLPQGGVESVRIGCWLARDVVQEIAGTAVPPVHA